MSATEPGDYIVTVTRPTGDQATWTGYADSVTDALARAEAHVDPAHAITRAEAIRAIYRLDRP